MKWITATWAGLLLLPLSGSAQSELPAATPTPEATVQPETTPVPTATPEVTATPLPTETPVPAPQIEPEKELAEPPAPPEAKTENKRAVSADGSGEFRELSISLMPGMQKMLKNPAGFKDPSFTFGAHIHYFLHRYVALNVPYAYAYNGSHANNHRVGGGPLVRYLDYGMFRGSVDGSFDYVRMLGGNHIGWSAGGDFTVGSRSAKLRPFIGPYFRYEYTYLPGANMKSYSAGLAITLTNLADLD